MTIFIHRALFSARKIHRSHFLKSSIRLVDLLEPILRRVCIHQHYIVHCCYEFEVHCHYEFEVYYWLAGSTFIAGMV